MLKHHNPYFVVTDFDALTLELKKIRKNIDKELERLVNTLQIKSSWNVLTSNDARTNTIAHLGMLVDSTNLAFIFINEHLLPLDNSWWQEKYKPPFEGFSERDRGNTVNTFNNAFIKFAFIQYLFSVIDSSFRLFLRQIDSNAENGAKNEFFNIHKCLKLKLKPTLDNSDDLLNLLRETRNTIHNNGVYFNKKNSNKTITYKGKNYDFFDKKPIDFVTWEWLLEMLKDVLNLFIKVIYDPQVIGVMNEIIDPFSSNRKFSSK